MGQSEMPMALPIGGIQDRCTFSDVEFRDAADGNDATMAGYAAVFNQETVIDMGIVAWREKVAPQAFNETIAASDDVRAAVNHDVNRLLGRTKSGTLVLSVDAHGLRYDIKLPNTTVGNDTRELVRRRDITGSSFKFKIPDGGARMIDDGKKRADGLPLLLIERAKLLDVGPVTFPAYEGTSVVARNVPPQVVEFYRQREEDNESARAAAAATEAAKTPDLTAREAARAAVEKAKTWAS